MDGPKKSHRDKEAPFLGAHSLPACPACMTLCTLPRGCKDKGRGFIMRKALIFASCWMTCALCAPAQRPERQNGPDPGNLPETNPYSSAADVETGRRLYAGRCGHCHGQNGEGGRGATLNTGRFRHGGSGRELFLVIRDGIPNTEMPGAFRLPDAEIWRMVAYVQQLSRHGASDPVTGDAAVGAIVYQKNGCGQCHSIDGKGGFLGPDLTDIGARRAVRHLRESVLDPDADIPL